MILIYKELIKKYIKCLTPQDIQDFALSKNITLSNQEINIIFNFILKYQTELLNKDETPLKQLKLYLREDLYNEIYTLYNTYKIYI